MTSIIHPRFVHIKSVGAGRFGEVYHVRDRLTGDELALKYLDATVDSVTVIRQYGVIMRLHHPHIIPIYEVLHWQNHFVLVMAWLPDARPLLEAAENANIEQRCRWIHELLSALAYLHTLGILHCDLKPENVLICAGRVVVLDFGLARRIKGNDTPVRPGTLAYLAPETLTDGTVSIRSDLYAVGVLAYQLFFDTHPFAPYDETFIERVLKDNPATRDTAIPQEIKTVIYQLLAKQPQNRYASADDVLSDIRNIVDTIAASPSVPRIQIVPFIGREKEVEQVQEKLQSVRDGQGSTLLIGGESGVGKSRLLDEIKIQAVVQGFTVIRWRDWRDMITQLALITPLNENNHAALHTLEADDMTPEMRHHLLSGVLLDLIQHQPQPICLLLDDLHEDIHAISVLALLAQTASNDRLLLLATFRPDLVPDLPQEFPAAQILYLTHFDDEEAYQLVQRALPKATYSHQFMDAIFTQSGGNPLILLDMLEQLISHEQALSTDNLEAIASPNWGQRYQQALPQDTFDVLVLAACYGQQIDRRLLGAWVTSSDEWLRTCLQESILQMRGGDWHFRHEQIRLNIIQTVSDVRPYHARLAETIDHVYGMDAAHHLAHHWGAAGEIERERQYILEAARYYLTLDDRPKAHEVAQHAVVLLQDHPDSDRAHLLAGQACQRREDLDTARDHFATAITHTSDTLIATEAHVGLGEVAIQAEDFDAGRLYLNTALDSLASTSNQRHLHARVLDQIGASYMKQGHYAESLDYFQRSLGDYEAINDEVGLARVLRRIGIVEFYRANYEQAREYFETSLEYAERASHIGTRSAALRNLGIIAFRMGGLEESIAFYEQALALERKYGTRSNLAAGLGNLSISYQRLGDLQAAHDVMLEARQIYHTLGNQWGMATCDLNLSSILYELNEVEYARQYALSSLELREAIEDVTGMISSLRQLGNFALAAENIDAAEEHYERARALIESNGAEQFRLSVLRGQASVNAHQGKREDALQLLAQCIEQSRAQNSPDELLASLNLGIDLSCILDDTAIGYPYLREGVNLISRIESQNYIADFLVTLVDWLIADGQPDQATWLAGFLLSYDGTSPMEKKTLREKRSQIEAQLDAIHQGLWAQGANLDFAQVMDYLHQL